MLQVRNLKVQYFTRKRLIKAVDGVSFEIKKGETLGIIGESGCGKTTAALAILRLLRDAKIEGEVLFKGENLLKKSEKEMREIRGKKISMIFQESTGLNPVLRIGDQLHEVLEAHRSSIDAADLLDKVGISEPEIMLKCHPHELSSGMRQRVMIAIAIASKPELVIADEPTSMLDATIQIQILDLLDQLKKELTLLLISHDIDIIMRMSDSTAVMYAGRLVELYKTGSTPMHPYTRALLEIFSGGGSKQIGGTPDPAKPPGGCPYHPRCEYARQICAVDMPATKEVYSGHYLSCHFWGEI